MKHFSKYVGDVSKHDNKQWLYDWDMITDACQQHCHDAKKHSRQNAEGCDEDKWPEGVQDVNSEYIICTNFC